MRDVDKILHEAGAAWRATLENAHESEIPTIQTRRSFALVSAVVSIAIVAVVVTGGILVREARLGRTSGGDITTMVVRDGDRVQARGAVITVNGTSKVCILAGVRLRKYEPGQEPPPSCSPISVPLTEVPPELTTEWQDKSGVRYVLDVVVTGTWDHGAIAVIDIDSARPDEEQRWVMPCGSPFAGWDDPAAPVSEAALGSLAAEVAAHPDLYIGPWRGYEGGVPLSADLATTSLRSAMVVGTVGDPIEQQQQLGNVYRHGLCVIKVEFSAADLNPVAENFARADGTWQTDVDPATDRVHVRLPVVDEAAAIALEDVQKMIVAEPLVDVAS